MSERKVHEFEIDFWYILFQVLQRRNVYCIFTSKAVNENVFACILVVITVKIRIGLRKYLYFDHNVSVYRYWFIPYRRFKSSKLITVEKDLIVTYFAFVWQISCWYTEYCCPFRVCRVYIYDFHATPLKFWKIWSWN